MLSSGSDEISCSAAFVMTVVLTVFYSDLLRAVYNFAMNPNDTISSPTGAQVDVALSGLASPVRRFWKVFYEIEALYVFLYLHDSVPMWQHARTKAGDFTGENLSPRSKRLMCFLPKPKSLQDVVISNLTRMQEQVASQMEKIEKVQALSSNIIRDYFARIPHQKVFKILHRLCSSHFIKSAQKPRMPFPALPSDTRDLRLR